MIFSSYKINIKALSGKMHCVLMVEQMAQINTTGIEMAKFTEI
jgi:hypothetical protein